MSYSASIKCRFYCKKKLAISFNYVRFFHKVVYLTGAQSNMIAIIFEVFPKSSKKDEYLRLAAEMRSLVDQIEGFISVERFQSITNPNKLLSISLFENEAAVDEWRNLSAHRKMQSKGRKELFEDYDIKVVQVLRNYSMLDRKEAPTDSLLAGV